MAVLDGVNHSFPFESVYSFGFGLSHSLSLSLTLCLLLLSLLLWFRFSQFLNSGVPRNLKPFLSSIRTQPLRNLIWDSSQIYIPTRNFSSGYNHSQFCSLTLILKMQIYSKVIDIREQFEHKANLKIALTYANFVLPCMYVSQEKRF